MSVVVIHATATGYAVALPRQTGGSTETTTSTAEAPNPILPVGKEIIWGTASFLVLFIVMRLWLFPKLKKGMDARHARVQGDLDRAERLRAEAAEEVARFQAELAEVNAEAARIVEMARKQVDEDRQAKVTAANARIAERRAAAAAEMDAAREAALARTEAIVLEVAASGAERVLGAPVERDAVRPLVVEVMAAGAVTS